MTGEQDTPEHKGAGERIAKLLARAGIASRREIERMIAEGRIALNGVTLDTPATILPDLAGVTVDGQPVAQAERTRLFRFHKPSGLLTAERDPAGRPTIYTALRNALPPGTPRLMPIGRLDLNTEGLLLMTNDGGLKRLLELPANGVPRKYRARTFGEISQAQLEELIDGITVEGVNYGRIDANLERRTGRNQWVELTLSEGKNREVRRVLEHLGLQVSRLLRTAYGPFPLADLPRGSVDEIPHELLQRFVASLQRGAKTPMPLLDLRADVPPVHRPPPSKKAADKPSPPRAARVAPAGKPAATIRSGAAKGPAASGKPGKPYGEKRGSDDAAGGRAAGRPRKPYGEKREGRDASAERAAGRPGKPYGERRGSGGAVGERTADRPGKPYGERRRSSDASAERPRRAAGAGSRPEGAARRQDGKPDQAGPRGPGRPSGSGRSPARPSAKPGGKPTGKPPRRPKPLT